MSQDPNGLVIPTTGTLSGLTLVTDTNNALSALATQQAGAAQPPGTLWPYSRWYDTTNKVIKRRNAANNAWVLDAPGAEAFHVQKTASYSLALSDDGTYINIGGTTANTYTIPASTTLMDGWSVTLQNNTQQVQTIAPTGTDLLNGQNASLNLLPGYGVQLVNNGVSNTLVMFFGSDAPLPPGTPLMWLTPTPPSWAVVRDGSALNRGTFNELFAVLCPTRNGNTTSASTAVTSLATTTDLYVGMPVEGAGIPANTTIAAINSATTITLSAAATATATVPITLFYYGYGAGGNNQTFGLPDDRGVFERGLDSGVAGRDTLTYPCSNTVGTALITGLSGTAGLSVGMALSGTGVPAGATIAAINSATSFTMSANSTAQFYAISIAGNRIGAYAVDQLGAHNHTVVNQAFVGYTGVGGYNLFNPSGTTASGNTGNNETKPKNRSYLPIIVY